MATNPPDLTDPPAAPDPNDRVTFDTRAFSLVGWLATFVTQMKAALANVYANAQDAYTKASAAGDSANAATAGANLAADWAAKTGGSVAGGEYSAKYHALAAAASALTAVNAPGTSATSATNLTIGTGAKAMTIQANKALVPGMWVIVADAAAPGTNWMAGPITAYDPGTGALSVSASGFAGAGTKSSWVVSLTAPGGVTLGANTFTGPQTYSDQQIKQAMLVDIGYSMTDKGTVNSGTVTFDYTGGSEQRVQVGGTLTFAFANWPPTGNLGVMLVEIVNGNTGAITLPTINFVKPDGTTTTSLSTYLAAISRASLQAAGTDWLMVWTRDAGTTLWGKLL